MGEVILSRICSIEECNRPLRSKGLCERHYWRLYKHGSPNIVLKRPRCKIDWLEKHIHFQGDECLKWPFSVSKHGRGTLTIKGKNMSAPRAMCLLAHGDPPSSSHQAAHSCGKGHEGCVNPRHLRWATASENEMDKLKHGTLRRGHAINTSKLTEQQVREIITRGRAGGINKMAREFGVSPTAISYILSGKNWGWLDR